MNTAPIPRREHGYVLLLTLIVLVVLLFGALFITRGNLLQTVMTGNTVQRQKDVQIGDLALQQVGSAILQTCCTGGNPRKCSPPTAPLAWFPVIDASTPPPWSGVAPTPSFWASCLANNTCDTLAHIRSSVLGNLNPAPPAIPGSDNILVTVVPTTFPTDSSACSSRSPNGVTNPDPSHTANYYEIFLNIREANGRTAATTDSIYKLCALGSS